MEQINKDTEALRQTMILAQQLEQDITDINAMIYEQGDRMRVCKQSLEQSNDQLKTTDKTLDSMSSCILI